MASLLDIAPLTEKVMVRGTELEVVEVSAKSIGMLLYRFPELRMLMAGRDVTPDRLIEAGGDLVAAVIAAGLGAPNDPQQEAAAARLGPEPVIELLAAILRLTIPGGVGPFVERLMGLIGPLGAVSRTAPATSSPKPSKP